MNDSRIITAPDTDLDHRFKILLVDVEWGDIERLSQSINSLKFPITVFLYGSNDSDDMWCINVQRIVNATLVNSRFSGTKELLKGWLLAQRNTYSLGTNAIAAASHKEIFDIYSWMMLKYNNYLKEENNE